MINCWTISFKLTTIKTFFKKNFSLPILNFLLLHIGIATSEPAITAPVVTPIPNKTAAPVVYATVNATPAPTIL